jgi:mono/diheme cytochrome c family protein
MRSTCSASSSPDVQRAGPARIRSAARVLGVLALAAVLASGCGGGSSSSSAGPTTGRAIYVARCQTCHNRHGEGFVGPNLIDISERYPNVADQIAVVTNGKANMPAFGGQLTAKQIATVVEYTRTAFATTTSTSPVLGPPTPTTSSP